MIDIYDEATYVKEILEHGLSVRWRRDGVLLVKYYKSLGYKRKEAKRLLKEKCKKYVAGYNEYTHYKEINNIMNKGWAIPKEELSNPDKKVVFREIREITFSKNILDWFINLENYEISEQQKQKIEQKRKKEIGCTPLSQKEIRFLFTIFVWTKIQENYHSKPRMHYINNCLSKFKEDSGISNTKDIKDARNILYDLGFIKVNHSLGIEAVFMDLPIFNEDHSEEIKITGQDLYYCGDWIVKWINGFFVCRGCGREIPFSSKKRMGAPPKWCKKCSPRNKKGVREITCADCKKTFVVPSSYKSVYRCSECQDKYRKERDRERHKREKEENSASLL